MLGMDTNVHITTGLALNGILSTPHACVRPLPLSLCALSHLLHVPPPRRMPEILIRPGEPPRTRRHRIRILEEFMEKGQKHL